MSDLTKALLDEWAKIPHRHTPKCYRKTESRNTPAEGFRGNLFIGLLCRWPNTFVHMHSGVITRLCISGKNVKDFVVINIIINGDMSRFFFLFFFTFGL